VPPRRDGTLQDNIYWTQKKIIIKNIKLNKLPKGRKRINVIYHAKSGTMILKIAEI